MKLFIYDVIGVNLKQFDRMIIPLVFFITSILISLKMSHTIIIAGSYIFLMEYFSVGMRLQKMILRFHSGLYSRHYKIMIVDDGSGFEIDVGGVKQVFEVGWSYPGFPEKANISEYVLNKMDGLVEYCFENKIKHEDVCRYYKEAYNLSARLRSQF